MNQKINNKFVKALGKHVFFNLTDNEASFFAPFINDLDAIIPKYLKYSKEIHLPPSYYPKFNRNYVANKNNSKTNKNVLLNRKRSVILNLHKQLKEKKVTPAQLACNAKSVINKFAFTNSVVTPVFDAKNAKFNESNLLSCIPYSIKDNISTKGIRTLVVANC